MSLSVEPLTRFLGIAPSGLGFMIWPSTTPLMVFRSRPSATLALKASSRFGPTMPLVAARASVWQEPHFDTNAFLPAIRLALSEDLTAEQPAVTSTSTSSRHAAAARLALEPSGERGW